MEEVTIQIPNYVSEVLDALSRVGFEAYVVGGCVRDAILGRTPADWDVTTNALPVDVERLFARTLPTGVQHGTITVLTKQKPVEVTTYRVDGAYEDLRHPKDVTFTASLREDLRRRDFTINAMAYNASAGLVDAFDGLKDLEEKKIRCVGDAKERFSEDALRILRAFRFAAQLDFSLDDQTRMAAKELAGNLEKISAERVRDELLKLICSDRPEKLIEVYQAGATAVFLPEFDVCMETPQNNPYHHLNVGAHIVESMRHIRPEKTLRLTMLLHDIAKPLTRTTDENGVDHFYGHPEKSADMARRILRRLKLDNQTIADVTALTKYHDAFLEQAPKAEKVRRVMRAVGRERFPLLLEVIDADNAAKSPEKRPLQDARTEHIRSRYAQILEDNDAVEIAELAANGQDLIALGIAEGKTIGELLSRMLDEVLRVPAHNTKEWLLDARQIKRFTAASQQDGERT